MLFSGDAARLGARLRPFLDRVVERYGHPRYLDTDPLVVVRSFRDPLDREYGGLFAALLAYGRVSQINASLARLFAMMDGHPAAFVRGFGEARARRALAGFKHRFTDADDVLCLCRLLHRVARGHASLGEVFVRHCRPDDPDIVPALGRFVDELLAGEPGGGALRAVPARQSFRHLLPHPAGGSACKRLFLYLRWMIRADDGIDMGLWQGIPPLLLVAPVDTHMLRIMTNLGAVDGRAASLKAARQITGVLRGADPDDPVRYDFPLCRIGILQDCPSRRSAEACRRCELRGVCARSTGEH